MFKWVAVYIIAMCFFFGILIGVAKAHGTVELPSLISPISTNVEITVFNEITGVNGFDVD